MLQGASASNLTSRHCADDEKRLHAVGDGLGERCVGPLMWEILLAGKESHVRPASLRDVVAYRSAQHRVPRLEGIEYRALRNLTGYFEADFAVDSRERAQMRRKDNANHGSVCASTERTAGKSRAMAVQWSPESEEA
jgi:hypothetical protein